MQLDSPNHRFVVASRYCIAILFLMLCNAAFCGVARADDDWSTDWGKTLKAARADTSRPILIKYEASWCGPCKMLTAEMQQANVKAILGDFHLLRIDVDPVQGLFSHRPDRRLTQRRNWCVECAHTDRSVHVRPPGFTCPFTARTRRHCSSLEQLRPF